MCPRCGPISWHMSYLVSEQAPDMCVNRTSLHMFIFLIFVNSKSLLGLAIILLWTKSTFFEDDTCFPKQKNVCHQYHYHNLWNKLSFHWRELELPYLHIWKCREKLNGQNSFFKVCVFFNVFIEFVITLLLFCVFVFGHESYEILAPLTRDQTHISRFGR